MILQPRLIVANKSLRSCIDLRSGSRVTEEQFLLFRTICPRVARPTVFDPATFGLTQAIQNARGILATSSDYQFYKQNVRTADWASQGLNIFTLPLRSQETVQKPLQHGNEDMTRADETSVNQFH